MSMGSCRKCGCRCDPSDLQGGVCDDCREEERQQEERLDNRLAMLAHHVTEQEDGQIVMII